jgi:hypothetical protein
MEDNVAWVIAILIAVVIWNIFTFPKYGPCRALVESRYGRQVMIPFLGLCVGLCILKLPNDDETKVATGVAFLSVILITMTRLGKDSIIYNDSFLEAIVVVLFTAYVTSATIVCSKDKTLAFVYLLACLVVLSLLSGLMRSKALNPSKMGGRNHGYHALTSVAIAAALALLNGLSTRDEEERDNYKTTIVTSLYFVLIFLPLVVSIFKTKTRTPFVPSPLSSLSLSSF